MKATFQIFDKHGSEIMDVEFYIDRADGVIETVELTTWGDSVTLRGRDLQIFIAAFGGRTKIIDRASLQEVEDACSRAKELKEQKLVDEAG